MEFLIIRLMRYLLIPFWVAMTGFSFGATGLNERPYLIIPEPAKVDVTAGATCATPKLLEKTLNKSLGKDAYKLTIKPAGITLEYGDKSGFFYGLQTLNQLKEQYPNADIPCGVIEDRPRFAWRSMMLDVARHFVPVADIRKFIDVMSFYKFNKLHLHLSDDQGWRVPIPAYPKLKSVASKRAETFSNKTPHEGMYTKEELKDLVRYAASKNIEIIPEIDVPGHNQALCSAYPEFLCFPDPGMKVRTDAGISHTLVCPGKPGVWKFYDAVFNELKDIFPSQYVHLGGDEAPEDNWMKCPKCEAFRKKVGITENDKKKAAQQEMVEFFTRLTAMLKNKGKKSIFWYEPMGKYPEGTIVTTWRGGHTPQTVAKTSGSKTEVICAPNGTNYFDYPQLPGDWPTGQPDTGWMPLNTIENAYSVDPGAGLSPEELKKVIGVECCLWSERMPTIERVFYQAYPRCLATVETGWSPMEARDLERFKKKVEFHKKLIQSKWGIPMDRPEKK